MPVKTPVLTNAASQPVTTYNANIDANFNVADRIAWAFAPHEQATPDMTMRLDAGYIPAVGALPLEVAAQSTGTITPPSANPRRDIVYIDATDGSVGVSTGTEGANPVDPEIPANKIAVARINLFTSQTTITNADLDDLRCLPGAGSFENVLLQGEHALFIPAEFITPQMTNPCANIATLETANNLVNYTYRAFEASSVEYGQIGLFLPKSWNGGTIQYRVAWSHPETTTSFGVVWSLCGVSVGDGEALDSAFGSAVQVSDTGGATDTLYVTDWSDPVTIAGAGSSEEQILKIGRLVNDEDDTLAVGARLHRIEILLTIDKGTDE